MSDATKSKMKKMGLDPAVVDKLDAAGLCLPLQIKQAEDAALESAGLLLSEVYAVRERFPGLVAQEAKALEVSSNEKPPALEPEPAVVVEETTPAKPRKAKAKK